MNINLPGSKNYLQLNGQLTLEQVGSLKGHIVKFLNPTLASIRQDPHLAGVTIATANILLFEIAYRMAKLIIGTTMDTFGPLQTWSRNRIWTTLFFAISVPYSFAVAMNMIMYKGLTPPLRPIEVAAISVITCATYAFFSFKR